LTPDDLSWDSTKPIDDEKLIKWFQKNYTKISYLNFKVHRRYPSQIKKIKKEIADLKPGEDLSHQKVRLLKIWEYLIGSAIVFLKLKDARELHHDDEDYGVGNLSKFFKSFTDFETVFYGADKHYRDHVSHMFKVFLLGEYLLVEKKIFPEILICEDLLDKKFCITDAEKEAIWCITSLSHDLGYGMRLVPKINTKTRSMLEKFDIFNIQELGFPFPSTPFNEFVIMFISSDLREMSEKEIDSSKKKENKKIPLPEDRRKYLNHTQSKYFLKFSRAFDHFSHGVFSSILLVKNCIYFLESDFTLNPSKPLNQLDARNFLIRQTILRSIASHDCDEIYYLTLPQFPFLLRIMDEMQDWGRPGLSDLFKNKPEVDLYVEELDKTHISYKCVYRDLPDKPMDEKDKEEFVFLFREEFIRKCQIFRKILRSAVGGELRDLELRFTIEDQISKPTTRQSTYSFIHITPKDVFVTRDKKTISWHEFMEEVEQKNQERKRITDAINRYVL